MPTFGFYDNLHCIYVIIPHKSPNLYELQLKWEYKLTLKSKQFCTDCIFQLLIVFVF